MSADPTEKEIAILTRPHRALALLKEVYRVKTGTNSMGFASHEIWRQVCELLAEETPGTVQTPGKAVDQ